VNATKKNSQNSRFYYVCVAIEMRAGGLQLARLHTEADPRTLTADELDELMLTVVTARGLKQTDIADTGDGPCMAVSVWDTEADCKAAYDDAVRDTGRDGRNTPPRPFTADDQMTVASALFEAFADILDEPREAWPAAFSARLDEDRTDVGMQIARALSATPEGTLSLFAHALWARVGFPKITMGHRFAASLLVTTASSEAVSMVRAPFPAFVIELPESLLSVDDPSGGGQRSLRRVLVTTMPDPRNEDSFAWGFTAHADNGVCVWRAGVQSADMQPAYGEDMEALTVDAFNFRTTSRDERVMALLGRLIINTCLAMSDPGRVHAVGPGHTAWRRHQAGGPVRSSPEPVVRMFRVGRPVTHDFRDAVREYIDGRRRTLSVQSVVAGHYKTQPHGPRSALRKLIWREPYWRGPEDAPIAVRPHEMRDGPVKATPRTSDAVDAVGAKKAAAS